MIDYMKANISRFRVILTLLVLFLGGCNEAVLGNFLVILLALIIFFATTSITTGGK